MDRISIKKVHFSEALSEETNAYTADVYLDGKKFGMARNNGQGGCTHIMPYANKRGIQEEAEAYANSLGEIEYNSNSIGKFTMKASLDAVVDKLFNDHIEAKHLRKEMRNAIVYRTPKGELMKMKFNKSLAQISKMPKGMEHLEKQINSLKEEGNTILNTNILGAK